MPCAGLTSWGGPGQAYLYGHGARGRANTDGVGGCGETPGTGVLGDRRPRAGVGGPTIAAQELGHNFGRRHATSGCDADEPGRQLPGAGWSFWMTGESTWRCARSTRSRPRATTTWVTAVGQDNTWTSVYTYLTLLRELPVAECAIRWRPAGGALPRRRRADARRRGHDLRRRFHPRARLLPGVSGRWDRGWPASRAVHGRSSSTLPAGSSTAATST